MNLLEVESVSGAASERQILLASDGRSMSIPEDTVDGGGVVVPAPAVEESPFHNFMAAAAAAGFNSASTSNTSNNNNASSAANFFFWPWASYETSGSSDGANNTGSTETPANRGVGEGDGGSMEAFYRFNAGKSTEVGEVNLSQQQQQETASSGGELVTSNQLSNEPTSASFKMPQQPAMMLMGGSGGMMSNAYHDFVLPMTSGSSTASSSGNIFNPTTATSNNGSIASFNFYNAMQQHLSPYPYFVHPSFGRYGTDLPCASAGSVDESTASGPGTLALSSGGAGGSSNSPRSIHQHNLEQHLGGHHAAPQQHPSAQTATFNSSFRNNNDSSTVSASGAAENAFLISPVGDVELRMQHPHHQLHHKFNNMEGELSASHSGMMMIRTGEEDNNNGSAPLGSGGSGMKLETSSSLLHQTHQLQQRECSEAGAANSAYSSSNSAALMTHFGCNAPPAKGYKCKVCHQLCFSRHDLAKHNSNVHKSDPRPYRCGHCGRQFSTSAYLSQHRRIHLGIKPYACHFCERRFTQLSHVQQHERIHTGEKPYRCSSCMKSFTQMSNLQSHQRQHMKGKAYRCESCFMSFDSHEDLEIHVQAKHAGHKYSKILVCPICGKNYNSETYLNKHLLKHKESVSAAAANMSVAAWASVAAVAQLSGSAAAAAASGMHSVGATGVAMAGTHHHHPHHHLVSNGDMMNSTHNHFHFPTFPTAHGLMMDPAAAFAASMGAHQQQGGLMSTGSSSSFLSNIRRARSSREYFYRQPTSLPLKEEADLFMSHPVLAYPSSMGSRGPIGQVSNVTGQLPSYFVPHPAAHQQSADVFAAAMATFPGAYGSNPADFLAGPTQHSLSMSQNQAHHQKYNTLAAFDTCSRNFPALSAVVDHASLFLDPAMSPAGLSGMPAPGPPPMAPSAAAAAAALVMRGEEMMLPSMGQHSSTIPHHHGLGSASSSSTGRSHQKGLKFPTELSAAAGLAAMVAGGLREHPACSVMDLHQQLAAAAAASNSSVEPLNMMVSHQQHQQHLQIQQHQADLMQQASEDRLSQHNREDEDEKLSKGGFHLKHFGQ